MDESNEPLMLPNGQVYGRYAFHDALSYRLTLWSSTALVAMAAQNTGYVTCPQTGDVFSLEDAVRVFVS